MSNLASNLWQGLNRLEFCENAIFLELTSKSQGRRRVSTHIIESRHGSGVDGSAITEAFLDDFALVAAGDGGSDNVAATCLEWNAETPSSIILRVSRNEGLEGTVCQDLQEILNVAKSEPKYAPVHGGQEANNDTILRKIVQLCSGRVRKHAKGLMGELKNARCLVDNACRPPVYNACSTVVEARSDLTILGMYCEDNHAEYAELIHQRMTTLRRLCTRVELSHVGCVADLCDIVRTAFTLRHSSLLRHWLQRNLRLQTKTTTMNTLIEAILKRVGKLSRFFRARLTITKFVEALEPITTTITVVGLETQRVRIDELRGRSPADLRAGARSNLLRNFADGKLKSKLLLWDRYRVHAEVQLLFFYEENQDIIETVNYIGGDKLCCYLCYHFITTHARFKVNGCHQSLYSLWMVPTSASALSSQRAARVHDSLEQLCTLLQDKVRQVTRQANFRRLYHPEGESWDNLSRASFLSDIDFQRSQLRRYLRRATNVKSITINQNDSQTVELVTKAAAHLRISEHKQKQSCRPDGNSSIHTNDSSQLLKPTSETSESPVNINDICDSREALSQQARTFHDLSSQQCEAHTTFIRDHESRACEVQIAQTEGEPCPSLPDSDGHGSPSVCAINSQKIDFHEMELFVDFELPNTASVFQEPNEAPTSFSSKVIDVAAMQYGMDYVIDFSQDSMHRRELFFVLKQKDGKQRWLKLRWENVAS